MQQPAMARNLAVAYENLASLLDAGVPLLRSLETVGAGLKSPHRQAFLEIKELLGKSGSSLAEAMARRPTVFAPLDVMIVNAGETSGNLPEVFKLLAHWYEFSNRMKRRMLSGLLLPAMVLHVGALAAPLPAFILEGFHVIPYLTSVLRILLIFYVPAAIIFSIVRFTPTTGLPRRLLDTLVLKVPLLGGALYRLALSRYCWVFHILSKAGVPVTETADKARMAAGNAVVSQMFEPVAAAVKAGQPASQGLSKRLTPEFREIWQIGEETGSLDDVTKRLADKYAESAEFRLNEFIRWLPRLVYFLISALMVYYIFKNFSHIMSTGYEF